MKLALLLGLMLIGCATHPKLGPVFDKVNGVHTEKADDAGARDTSGLDFNSLQNAPRFPIIYFDFDQSHIKQEYLDSISKILGDRKNDWTCNVDGHASEEGTNDYNLALGERRAYAVGTYIANYQGVRSHEQSYGEERPVTTDPEGQWKNRRVEVRCH